MGRACAKGDFNASIDRGAGRIGVRHLLHKGHQRRLADLELFTVEQRRLWGLLIETYEIIKGFSVMAMTSVFELSMIKTRNLGWVGAVQVQHCALALPNVLGCSLCNMWNSLPEAAVNAPSIDAFKRRLKKILPGLFLWGTLVWLASSNSFPNYDIFRFWKCS